MCVCVYTRVFCTVVHVVFVYIYIYITTHGCRFIYSFICTHTQACFGEPFPGFLGTDKFSGTRLV